MKHNHKRFIQYALALTTGLSLGGLSMTSPSKAAFEFNGIHLNGISFNGISFNGISFNGIGHNRISLNRLDQIKPNTTIATLAGKPVQEFRVEKGQLVLRLPSVQQ